MFSHEIEDILKKHNYNIDSKLYQHICSSSPQISRIYYDAGQNIFHIDTKDDFHFHFNVYYKP